MDPWRWLSVVAIVEIGIFVCLCNGAFVLEVDHKFARLGRNLAAYKAHDAGRHRRFLSAVDIPLGGNGLPSSYGLYFAKIGLGNPPNDYYVQVDTGSDILWVNCIGCQKCPKASDLGVQLTLYNPSASSNSSSVYCGDEFCLSTYKVEDPGCKNRTLCQYNVVYGDGSRTQGYFVKDMVQLRKVSGDYQTSTLNGTIIFGCGNVQTGMLGSASEALDGILGFGQANSSMLSQLASAGKVRKVFSHCLDTVKGGGSFVIGEIVSPKVNTTPLDTKKDHYNVVLQSIDVGGNKLNAYSSDITSTGDGHSTIIDSGTTLAYFPETIYSEIMKQILSTQPSLALHTLEEEFQCFSHIGNVDDIFPNVTFHFRNSLTLIARPSDYLFDVKNDVWCFGWQPSPSTTKDGGNILLGDLVLSNKLVVYDLEKNVIGWSDYNCSASVKVREDGSSPTFSVSSHNISSATSLTVGKLGTLLLFISFVLRHRLM